MDLDFFGMLASVVVGVIVFVFGLGFLMYLYTVNIGEANLIKITNKEDVIYEGKQAFTSIDSGGMTTSITIYKSLFPFQVVDKKYSSSDIKVMPK